MNATASLRWLGDPTPNLTEIRGALLDVMDAGNWASELIQRNRELFKQHTVRKEPLDIHDVVRDVAVLAQTRLQDRRVVLTTSLASGLPAVVGDRIELQQVLLNLIVNSIDATESIDPGARRIDVATTLIPTGVVKVSVRDNGVGLDGVDVRQMFSLSYTTKANGTGIGLSLSRSIVEAHGGTLWAEPNADGGATFSFTVPVHGTHPQQQPAVAGVTTSGDDSREPSGRHRHPHDRSTAAVISDTFTPHRVSSDLTHEMPWVTLTSLDRRRVAPSRCSYCTAESAVSIQGAASSTRSSWKRRVLLGVSVSALAVCLLVVLAASPSILRPPAGSSPVASPTCSKASTLP